MVFTLHAQHKKESGKAVIVNTLSQTFSYEYLLGSRDVLLGQTARITPSLGWRPYVGFGYSINPGWGVSWRIHYNEDQLADRINTLNNLPINDTSIDDMYMFSPIASRENRLTTSWQVTPRWGMRMIYDDSWSLEFNAGVHCLILSRAPVALSPRLNVKLGVVF